MLDLGFVVLLTAWSAGVGLRVLNRLGPRPEHPADALALAVPLGLGLLSLAVLGLGECGALDRSGLLWVAAFGAWFGCRQGWLPWVAGAKSSCAGAEARATKTWPRPSKPSLIMGATLALTVLGTLLTALAPVTDGDALCYHLQVPKLFLARGAAVFDPDLHETVYPLLTELLYAVALEFRGPVACRLAQWVLGLVFAANVTALARPSLGARAWWAGTIALLVPAVSNGMSAPLNDVALAAFGTAALVAWSRYHERPGRQAAVLAGLITGLSLGVKYPALVLAALLGKTIAARSYPRFCLSLWERLLWRRVFPTEDDAQEPPRRPRLWHAILFMMTVLLTGGGWYLRAAWHTGNPVYPFFRHTFGGAGLDEVLDPIKRPMEVGTWNLLTALRPLTLEPDRFDSFSHQFGPVFLLFLPALLLERPPRRVVGITALGYLFLIICLSQRQSTRFVLIAVGPLALAVAWLADRWWERRSLAGRVLVGVLLLALGFEASLALARARHGLGVVLGRESPEDYLARREPTFRVASWVAENLPRAARLVGQDHRGFYFPRDYTMERAHRRRTGLGRHGESAEVVVERLRSEGFTHVLLCPPVPETAVEFDPTLGRLLSPWLAEQTPLYREDLTDADGVVRRYAIYSLSELPIRAQAEGRMRR
jgi:hypothetical protein